MTKSDLGIIGGHPIEISAEAEGFLRHLPQPALERILEAMRVWADTSQPPIRAARAKLVSDMEDEDWRELVIELLLEVDPETAFGLWDQVGAAIRPVLDNLPKREREKFDTHLGIHLQWNADWWNVS